MTSFLEPAPPEPPVPPSVAAGLVDTDFQQYDKIDLYLAEECARFYDDPLGWVLWAFDWDYGELQGFTGPDVWQHDTLVLIGELVRANDFNGVDPVDAIRMVTASGHGIGKSALTSWLIFWIMSTRPFAKGIVTANTGEQLRTKTWSELGKWRSRCIVGHWFEYNNGKGSMSLYHKSWPESWRVDAQTCREENSEAFAGLHAANSTPFYLFDEASAIPDKIWEVAEGGLTDGEPMFFCFGNPTRNTGKFREKFDSPRWVNRQIDSRDAKMTNKKLIAEWISDHGEDSDFVKVRVRGVFPSAGDMQFIPGDLVDYAMSRNMPMYTGHEPLIAAFDVARGGGDDCRLGFRRGRDARSEKSYRIPYEQSADSMVVVGKIVLALERHKPDVIFVDETGVGGPVLDRLKQLGWNAIGVHFGANADDDTRFYNKTAEMGYRLRQWLLEGGVMPNNEQLKRELTCREYWHDDKDRWVLERKKDVKTRLGYSPDWADQMYLLFAMENIPQLPQKRGDADVAPHARGNVQRSKDGHDPMADM